MVAIRTDGGVYVVMPRTARVVVDNCLVVEIEDVECAVGSEASLDGKEQEVATADEFGFAIFAGGVGGTVGSDEFVVNDVDRRFGGEVAVVVFFRPRPAVVDRATSGRGESANDIDLHV